MGEWRERQIEEVLENFNFEKVHRVMRGLNWVWGQEGRVPTLSQLIVHARRTMASAIREGGGATGSGGFEAEVFPDGTLVLRFVLEEWEAYAPGEKSKEAGGER